MALWIPFQKLRADARLPHKATEGAACFDFYSLEEYILQPGDSVNIPLGLAVAVPEDHVMLIFSRSGHGYTNSVRLRNCVGVIDSDYRGELVALLHADLHGDPNNGCWRPKDLTIRPGDRVAQGLVLPLPEVETHLADELPPTARGTGGFGSTGA